MKILFVITVLGHGRGGHFHSLNHISRSLGSRLPVGIMSIGPGASEVILNNPYFTRHIDFNGINILNLHKELKEVLNEFTPDILHFFDDNSYNALKPILNISSFKFIVNKCGGPNTMNFPKVENLVVFSEENNIWFQRQKKFKNTKLCVISNRATKLKLLPNKKITKDKESFCFVRISRIGNTYIKSLLDSINLISKLKDDHGLNVKLYIVGTIQEKSTYNDLHRLVNKRAEVILITEDEFTKEASKMLYLADAVIGTGRSVMEASSLGLPVLTPAFNSELPILITKNNYDNFFRTNFSERNMADKTDLEKNLELIKELVEDKNFYKDSSKLSNELFARYFDVDKGYEKYFEVYKSALLSDKKVSKFTDLKAKLRTYYLFYNKSKSKR